MIGPLPAPWLVIAALVLLAPSMARQRRAVSRDLWWLALLFAGALAARLLAGVWGPLHVNGQGPLWIRGALEPEALAAYGPGYFELFGWIARLSTPPDQALFLANAVLSASSPVLLYAAARLAGVARGSAFAVALVLAADGVTIRTAASEGYYASLIALVLSTQVALLLGVRAHVRGEGGLRNLAIVAGGLLAAAAARIHPMVYLPLALCPLVVFGAAEPRAWRSRLALAAAAAAAIGLGVVLTSGAIVVNALGSSPMAGQAMSGLAGRDHAWLLGLIVIALLLGRWLSFGLLLLCAFSFALLVATQSAFQQHPLWALCYQRIYLPGILLGAAALLPRGIRPLWPLLGGVAAAAFLLGPAWPHLGRLTTEQLEYRFLREILSGAPPDCTLAAVNRAERRVWEIPSYLVPSRAAGGTPRTVQSSSDLRAVAPGDCLLYVRSSLCTSAEARSRCDSVERGVALERLASAVFAAVPSYSGLPYDRSEVEVVVFRVTGEGTVSQSGAAGVGDGAPITPAFAQALYERVAPLRESDGCRLVQFDTHRFRIVIGLEDSSGARQSFELATQRRGAGGRTVGGWALAVPAEIERQCGTTLTGIERVLLETTAPRRTEGRPVLDLFDWHRKQESTSFWFVPTSYDLLKSSFVLLLLGTAYLLYREMRARRPSPYWVLGLVVVWGVGLGLRLSLSPRTFLHEYYHVAETINGLLVGQHPPTYGNTGPALFRLVGALLGRSEDVQVIFVTNAVVASLAIPAVALLDLALQQSWPRALCAAVLLCILPQHLRFSAAEDLFVQAVTFGMWALGLFALYLRTHRLGDALVAALALSLAVQTRPEMLIFPLTLVGLVALVERSSWRLLFAWRTLLALSLLVVLLIPRFVDLRQALQSGPAQASGLDLYLYLNNLVFFHAQVTPPVYWLLLMLGMIGGLSRKPGMVVWVALVYLGYTLFSLSLFSNAIYNVRSQLLPNSYLVLIAAGAATLWMEAWGPRRRLALGAGACALVLLTASVIARSRDFVTELRDQQLEWAFLERTVAQLPERATLLSAVEVGGRNLGAFPDFLLRRSGREYAMVDVRRAASGEKAWPAPGENVLFYQGMFCYFAALPGEPRPDPISPPCAAVHERYVMEPLFTDELRTQGYSSMPYADGPYRIGFFRLIGRRG